MQTKLEPSVICSRKIDFHSVNCLKELYCFICGESGETWLFNASGCRVGTELDDISNHYARDTAIRDVNRFIYDRECPFIGDTLNSGDRSSSAGHAVNKFAALGLEGAKAANVYFRFRTAIKKGLDGISCGFEPMVSFKACDATKLLRRPFVRRCKAYKLRDVTR